MASINSMPLEVIDSIIRRAASSVYAHKFENQLALTARISSSWTTFSQEVLHSNLILNNRKQARAWLESGKAGEFKTRVLYLRSNIDPETSRKVLEKMNGLNELRLCLSDEFDMNILQDERLSDLRLLRIAFMTPLMFNSNNSGPFKFTFQLRALIFADHSPFSLQFLTTLLLSSPSLESLDLWRCASDLRPILESAELLQLHSLKTYPLKHLPTLSNFPNLRSLRTATEYGTDTQTELDQLEKSLYTLSSGQLMRFELNCKGEEEITVAMLEKIAMMVKGIPGLQELEKLKIRYSGQELDRMKELVLEWKERGIDAEFTELELELD